MAILSGMSLFYVSKSGNIEKVVATSDERSGEVDVRFNDGRIAAINVFNIFRTDVAANIASQIRSRLSSRNPIESPKFFRDPAK
jgi:hypothetical protein